ncbi:AfsR/SARP family transcriptional regulator [Solicola gregarius]|uniref:NB-ARC domain-containing protein n=1 Tax=Solicola gregarius TaxID=2908642 RepID=A0AA46YKY2_9ACTN|nr:BTAD domain-containing putative transcriptional regulator [Solicola gregarius]UYM06285.1 NB-ARC domain-containing protein [Solicola gregarius]
MSTVVDYQVLGPLEVHRDGRPVEVTAGKLRIVLATLLLRSNRTVSIGELIDVLWDGADPNNARAIVQKYILRVRRILGDDVIRTDLDGYRLVVADGQLDLLRFRGLLADADAASASGDPAAESRILSHALSLWSSQSPLSNVSSDSLVQDERPRLVELYLRTLERRVELDLQLGRHREVVGELMTLVKEHPLHERFWAQWMRALHGSGRTGEALGAYREVATLLLDELGVAPGRELRKAHETILQADAESAERVDQDVLPAVPHQLPIASSGFVGRRGESDQVAGLLGSAVDGGSALVLLMTGPAGVGKTTLAVHAAHASAAAFPDGELYCDLRAYAPGPDVSVEEVLGRFMQALGLPAETIPITRPEQTATYRSLLADKRVLVVLDNVRTEDQVRDLLPGSGGSAVIVTSRNELAGLVVDPGAHQIGLDVLSPDESRELLTQAVGRARVTREDAAVRALSALCGGLALALRLAAAHLALHQRLSIAEYAEQLRAHGALAALRVEGDERADLSSAFSWSYSLLSTDQQRLLRILSTIAEADFSVRAVCAVLDSDERTTARLLDELAAASLLIRAERRYRFHDLIRSYVWQQCLIEESHADRLRARERLLDYYIAMTDLAVQPVMTVSRLPRATTDLTVVLDPEPSLDQIDEDRPAIIAAVRAAAADGPYEKACYLADALRGYFMLRGHTVDWLAAVEGGLLGAQRAGYREGIAAMLNSRGALRYHTGDTTHAKEDLTTAVELYEALGVSGANAARINLGIIAQASGRLEEAIAHQEEAMRGYRRFGEPSLETRARENLVLALMESGDLQRAQRESAELEDGHGQARGHLSRGVIAMLTRYTGDLRRAVDLLSAAARVAESHGDRRLEVGLRDELANCHLERGAIDEAHRIVIENITGAKRDDPRNVPYVQTTLAKVYRAQQDTERARRQFEYALSVATEMRDTGVQCDVLTSLAGLELGVGDSDGAMRRVTHATELARDSGRMLRAVHADAVLAGCLRSMRREDQARDVAEAALWSAHKCGYPLGQGIALERLADLDLDSGDAPTAVRRLDEAAAIYSTIGSVRVDQVRQVRRVPEREG